MIKVVSVFAGLGKTTVGSKYDNICDLQSSPYRCDYSKIELKDYEKMKYDKSRVLNPDWPENYLKAINEAINKYDLVLVPSSEDVRQLLIENNIDFLFVLPKKDVLYRKKLINRYKKRGNNNDLINEVMYYFDNWCINPKYYNYPIEIIENNEYLEDLLFKLGYINRIKSLKILIQ